MKKASVGLNAGAILRAALYLVLGFFLAALLIKPLLGDPMMLYGADRNEKLAILQQDPYPYSTTFFGSSHVNLGFDPRVFDRDVADQPWAGRSFNMGVGGGSQIEQRLMALYYLKDLRRPAGDRPCILMLETTAGPTFSLAFTSHPRQINIFDLRSLEIVLHFHPPGYTRLYWLHHAAISAVVAFYHAIHMGMLSNRIFHPSLDRKLMQEETEDDHRGIHYEKDNAYYAADREDFFKRRLHPPQAVARELQDGNRMIVEDLHAAPNGSHVQYIWVSMPTLDDMQRYYLLPPTQKTSFGDVPILDMARPDLYPEIYQPSMWLDDQHLNEQGAALFSRLLAQQMIQRMANHPMTGCGG